MSNLGFLTVWEAQESWTTYMVAQDLKSSKQRELNNLGRHTALHFWILLVMSKSLKIAYVQGEGQRAPSLGGGVLKNVKTYATLQ